MKDGGAPAAPNNPAGRVLAFLRDFEAVKNRAPQNSAMAGLVELMGGAQEAPESMGLWRSCDCRREPLRTR
jgi:hypothetical protein